MNEKIIMQAKKHLFDFSKKSQFVIFADVPPKPTKDRLKKYAAAGFTYYNLTEDYVVRDGKNGVTDEYFNAIKKANDAGLKVILRTMRCNSPDYYDNITTEFKDKAQAFYFADEPSYSLVNWYGNNTLGGLHKFVEWHNKYAIDALFHINLLQSYGIKIIHGANAVPYETYLDKYINEVLVNVKGEKTLSTDHYPMAFDENGNHIKETVLYDYCLIAEKSRNLRQKGHNVVTAFCIQLVSDKGLKIRDPECPQDLTFQVALAVAFGAKALEYYLYVGNGCGAITDKKTQKEYSSVYGWIKEANKDLKKYGQILLSAEWQGVKFYNGEKVKDEHNANAFNAVKGYEKENFVLLKDFSCYADAIVSEFATENGYAYMAVNYTEPTKNQTNTVVFDFDGCKKATVYTGRTKRTERLKNGKLQIVLPSGGSAVILPE